MKNLTLIFFCLILWQLSFAQDENALQRDFSIFIRDTVLYPSEGNYYVINLLNNNQYQNDVVRILSNKYAIIRGNQKLNLSQGSSYYELNNSWKLSPGLNNRKSLLQNEHVFSIKYAAHVSPEFILKYDKIEIVRIIERAHVVLIKTTIGFIESQLINDQNVEYIDLAERKAMEESPIRQYNPGLNRVNYAKHNYPHLQGENMHISLKEHSIFEGDIDLLGKVVLDENSSNEFTQHAKEMGTLIAGLGNSFQTGEGVVPKANVVCTDFSSLFAEDESYYNSYQIILQNHSYGTGIENYYGNESVSYDQISFDNPELIHVFSAGNMGEQAPADGIYTGIEGYANLTGTYKQAKNLLVIGALDSAGKYVSRSSSGPAYDGRIKPELTAFGGEGSSESAALASGCVAMIQNHYKNKNGTNPSSSMIKSLLIAGSDDVHTPGIDFKTGYGSINLKGSLQLLDSGWYYEGALGLNENFLIKVGIPADAAELKVVLSWIDPPANPENATALVNDLDMTLEDPANIGVEPWILDHTPDANALSSVAIRGKDHLNNVEMITLTNPEPGDYKIMISCGQLSGDKQTFSVAYHITFKNNFTWTFPTESDHLEAGTSPYFRWENSYTDQDAELSIKYGTGDWETLGTVDIGTGQFKYTTRDTSTYALLKMAVSGMEYVSDTFTISRLAEISVENDCENEFILSWNQIENTEVYQLYELQSDRLIQIMSVNDTQVKIDKSINNGTYFAVQPIQLHQLKGLRSYALNYENSNKGCYLENFLAYRGLENNANIQLSVNVPQEIRQITIRKEQKGKSEIFAQFPTEGNNVFEFTDYEIIPGRVAYAAELSLNNGNTIFSDTLSFFFTDENTVIAFPNPVHNEFISILNDYPGGQLQLIDEKGTFVRQYDLVNTVDEIDLTGLRQGIYIFRIFYFGKKVFSGRIIRL